MIKDILTIAIKSLSLKLASFCFAASRALAGAGRRAVGVHDRMPTLRD